MDQAQELDSRLEIAVSRLFSARYAPRVLREQKLSSVTQNETTVAIYPNCTMN
jgi:hypothetical protein